MLDPYRVLKISEISIVRGSSITTNALKVRLTTNTLGSTLKSTVLSYPRRY